MDLPVLLSSSLFFSCTRPTSPAWHGADRATWQQIRDGLEAERAARPRNPWAAGVSMTMREPRSGRTVDGRGAIAVAPGRALRMILVGAAGGTMLDAWVTRTSWRIAVPPSDLVRRGGVEEPADLPIGFLRWSFFRPLEGILFGGSAQEGGRTFLLRDTDSVLEVRLRTCDRGELIVTTRRARGRTERIEECKAPAGDTSDPSRRSSAPVGAPRDGDWVRYEDEVSGLHIDLTFASAAGEPPDEDAFRDPDRTTEVGP
jgi:hypothetical protein